MKKAATDKPLKKKASTDKRLKKKASTDNPRVVAFESKAQAFLNAIPDKDLLNTAAFVFIVTLKDHPGFELRGSPVVSTPQLIYLPRPEGAEHESWS